MTRITKIEAASEAKSSKLRVAAYARVSTDYDKQLVSLETQKRHYERYIKSRHDWEYAGLYYDEGVSGSKIAKRDGFMKLLSDCDKGLIDYIVVKSISRFSRNTVDSVETVRRLCEKGIYIYFEKENIDTGKMESELLLSILSSLAESELRSISSNIAWSIQKRFMNGTFKLPYLPYGYKKENGMMVVEPGEAEIVREIFNSVLSGMSPGDVAKALNSRGVPSKRGAGWCSVTINKMIKNEKYVGDAIFQKTYTDSQFNRHRNHGERNMYLVRDHHEAIVSREIYEAAGAMIEANARDKGLRKGLKKCANRNAMSGKIVCGECGGGCKRVKIVGHFEYACKTHKEDKTRCGMKTVREDMIKAAFATMMNKLTFARSKVLGSYSQMLISGGDKHSRNRLGEIESLLEKNAERRKQVLQFFSKGLLDPAVYTEENDALMETERRLMAEKDEIFGQRSGDDEQQEALAHLLRYTAKGMYLDSFDDELFEEHVDHIVIVERSLIGFVMKCGPTFKERI